MDCSTADVPSNVVHDSPASYDSSDDEPLMKKKTISESAKKTETKDDTSLKSNGTNKKADVNTDDSSDNEPLIKITKMSSKAAKRKSVDSKQKESLDEDNSSDDEPLSELREKLHPQRQRKSPGTPSRKAAPVMKSKRNAARKKVKYTESSSDSSDDEPLATMKRKLTKTLKEQKTSANSKKTKPKPKDKSPEDSSSDDDVPLMNLIAKKKKPMKKNTKTTTASKSRASRKRQVSSRNSSDDEPLIKAARHPQVTKLLRIILKRCDGKEGVDTGTGSLNKSSAATTIDEKNLKEESQVSEESPEEE